MNRKTHSLAYVSKMINTFNTFNAFNAFNPLKMLKALKKLMVLGTCEVTPCQLIESIFVLREKKCSYAPLTIKL
jgi:hypothetical protein